MRKFNQEYLQQFHVDEEYELFVKAWMEYHKAADAVDGHLPYAGKGAVKAGLEARDRVISSDIIFEIIKRNDVVRYTKWQHAKLDALRRLGK